MAAMKGSHIQEYFRIFKVIKVGFFIRVPNLCLSCRRSLDMILVFVFAFPFWRAINTVGGNNGVVPFDGPGP